MKVTKEDILDIAKTASLTLTDEEVTEFVEDFDKIIGFADALKDVEIKDKDLDTSSISVYNVFREDKIEPSMDKEDIISNAPAQKNGSFFVPRVME